MSKTKKELLEEIECLKHNYKCLESTIEIQKQRLVKVCNYLENKGYSLKQINEILMLPMKIK